MSFQFALNAIRFEDVRAEVVKFLSENGTYDAKFDFAGSNLSYVIDTMAYTTMLMSYMISTVANDNFLDTTTLRKNAVSIAKTLGYKPKRVQSSRIEGTFTYRPGDVIFSDESKLTIPPNTVFTGTDDAYEWVNTEPIVLRVNPRDPFELTSAADPLTPRITLVQGTWRKYDYLGNGENLQTFQIPSTQIDENNMKVSVYTTQDGEGTKVEWTFARTFFQITSDEIYFVEEDVVNEGTPRIIFGNGIVGRAPANYETVTVDYLETVADTANGESDVEIPDTIVLNKSFDILTIDASILDFEPAGPSFGGAPYESLEDIKANAPRFFAAAGRAVTGNDFETLIETEFSYLVDQVAVFGGDELEPGNRDFLGNAYVAATPAAGNSEDSFTDNLQVYLTESSETEIITKLKDAGIIATEKYFLKPTYIYLSVEAIIELSSRISSAERDATEIQARSVLQDYFDNELDGFAIPYRESKARSQVEALVQVISADINTDYSFILNRDTFYVNRASQLWLPVLFERDENGSVVTNDQGYPETTNFVKTNTQTAADYDAGNQSLLELFRITLDANNEVTTERTKTVWHNPNTQGSTLDDYWTPELTPVIKTAELDISALAIDSTDAHFTFYTKRQGRDNDVWKVNYEYPDTIDDIGAGFVNISNGEYEFVTSYDSTTQVLTIQNPESFQIWVDDRLDALAAGPVWSTYELDGSDVTGFDALLRVWVLSLNGTDIVSVILNNDRTITSETLTNMGEWMLEMVEIQPNLEIRAADIINGIPYTSIRARRTYSQSSGRNLVPERVDDVMIGKTGLHGPLTTPDLDRYLYNNDQATVTVAELTIFTANNQKSLYQETFQFKGAGGNYYSSSLSWSSVNEFDQNVYSLYLNNTTSDARKKVSTLVWDKTEAGLDQFTILTTEDEAIWLREQLFDVSNPIDATSQNYRAFTLTVDENGVYSMTIQLAPALSNLKIDEKNLLCAFTTPGDGTSLYNVVDRYTREFTDSNGDKQPIEFTETAGVLSATWGTSTVIDMFDVAEDSTDYTGFSVTLTDEDSFRLFGLRTEIRIEPLNLITENAFGDVVSTDGYAVYAYGIFHNSVIGTFEYEAGDAIFVENVIGDYLGGDDVQETVTVHIREFFDNYGTGDDDVKMDIITIVPDNEYETVDGVEIIVGQETDFDSIFTQTIRADVLPIGSVLI